jgi:hypothetical protein
MSVNGTGPAACAEVAARNGASNATAPAARDKAESIHFSPLRADQSAKRQDRSRPGHDDHPLYGADTWSVSGILLPGQVSVK